MTADIVGAKFGRATVVKYERYTKVTCLCDCGVNFVTTKGNLVNGRTKSCGCIRSEVSGNRNKTHGMSGTKIYRVYTTMKERCSNPNCDKYPMYGGRGITLCSRWENSFENFYADMGDAPEGYSIDRIDNSKGYSPDNCRWASRVTQANNTRRSVLHKVGGESKTLREWCVHFNVEESYEVLRGRIKRGSTLEDALAKPIVNKRQVVSELTFEGVTRTFREWEKIKDLPSGIIHKRVARGWGAEKAISTPVLKGINKIFEAK